MGSVYDGQNTAAIGAGGAWAKTDGAQVDFVGRRQSADAAAEARRIDLQLGIGAGEYDVLGVRTVEIEHSATVDLDRPACIRPATRNGAGDLQRPAGDFDRAVVDNAGIGQGDVATGLDQRVRPDRHAAAADGRAVERQR